MNRVVVTGFDAFGSLVLNPAEAVARDVAAGNHPVYILPTSYSAAEEMVQTIIRKERPDALLMFGYAKDVPLLRLERYARNVNLSRAADNDGLIFHGSIAAHGPRIRATSFDVDQIAGDLNRQGMSITISEDAGGYVCNHVYYVALATIRRSLALFVHVSRSESSVVEAAASLLDQLSHGLVKYTPG
ncbi:MAG: pyroglutamyl-peptidase I [Mycobacteriales bacterium]